MTIDWNAFTPLSAAAGGLLIGIAAALLALLQGRIAGISGIVGGLLAPRAAGDTGWRLAFVGGLLLAPLLYRLVAEWQAPAVDAGWGTSEHVSVPAVPPVTVSADCRACPRARSLRHSSSWAPALPRCSCCVTCGASPCLSSPPCFPDLSLVSV